MDLRCLSHEASDDRSIVLLDLLWPMLDLIIIGAGPAGLSAAEAAVREGLNYLVIEKGTIANTIRQYPVGRAMFSTPNEVEMHRAR